MSASRASRPRRSRVGLLLAVAASCAGAWWLVQHFTGATGGGGDLAFVARPYVMYGLKPSFTRSGERLRTSNALGYRGAEIEQPKPAGRTRIVALGGSTTYGFAVDDEHTWPRQLEQLLRAARPDLDLEVINAGVESYTSAETLTSLAFRVLELDPDLIILHDVVNDVRPRRYAGFDPGYGHYRKVWDGDGSGYEDLGNRYPENRGINFFIQHLPPDPPGDALANLAAAGTGTYRRNLISILGIAAAHGVRAVLTTMPFDAARTGEDLATGMTQHNAILRELAAERGLPLVDMAAEFPSNRGWFVDEVHVDAEGSLAKARLVLEGLLPLLP